MTEFLEDKINILNRMIHQASLDMFQQQLIIKVAEESTGNELVDTNLQMSAESAAVQVLAYTHKINIYRDELAPLVAELGQ